MEKLLSLNQTGITDILLRFYSDWRTKEEDLTPLRSANVQPRVQEIPQQAPEGNAKSRFGRCFLFMLIFNINQTTFCFSD